MLVQVLILVPGQGFLPRLSERRIQSVNGFEDHCLHLWRKRIKIVFILPPVEFPLRMLDGALQPHGVGAAEAQEAVDGGDAAGGVGREVLEVQDVDVRGRRVAQPVQVEVLPRRDLH